MASRGRPRKAGKRNAKGRLVVMRDKGNERVVEARERFGNGYASASGRAFAGGILGHGDQAKDRLDVLDRLAQAKVTVFGRRGYRCALDQTPRGEDSDEAPNVIEARLRARGWLEVAEAAMGPGGFRAWELADPNYADAGPPWLDALLAGKAGEACDRALQSALAALDAITPVRKARMVAVG